MSIHTTTAFLFACALGFGCSHLHQEVSECLPGLHKEAETRNFFPKRARLDHLRLRGMRILLTPKEANTKISIDRKSLTVSMRLKP